MDRVFHQRFTWMAKSGIALFSLLTAYFFWERKGAVALLLMIVVLGTIERVIHTTYTFRRLRPIDREEEHEFLIIDRGRFSRNKAIPVAEITGIDAMKTAFGLDRYLLLTYGPGNTDSIQPENEAAFLEELKRRQKAERT